MFRILKREVLLLFDLVRLSDGDTKPSKETNITRRITLGWKVLERGQLFLTPHSRPLKATLG